MGLIITVLANGTNISIEEYQYATTSAYSPTLSELPLKGEFGTAWFPVRQHSLTSPSRAIGTWRMALEQGNRMALEHICRRV